jgi:hypothetical protein
MDFVYKFLVEMASAVVATEWVDNLEAIPDEAIRHQAAVETSLRTPSFVSPAGCAMAASINPA